MHMHACTRGEATRVFWGAQIGAALRRMLPLVPRFLVRGFGPEAPQLAPTKLDEDGWLVLELFPGLYEAPSEPPPTLTLLENSGLHDDYWPSDGGCVSFNGRHLSEAALRARKAAGELEGVGLGCLWRETVELREQADHLRDELQSHEHLSALENLLAIGARITAYERLREASTRVHDGPARASGPVAEAMRGLPAAVGRQGAARHDGRALALQGREGRLRAQRVRQAQLASSASRAAPRAATRRRARRRRADGAPPPCGATPTARARCSARCRAGCAPRRTRLDAAAAGGVCAPQRARRRPS